MFCELCDEMAVHPACNELQGESRDYFICPACTEEMENESESSGEEVLGDNVVLQFLRSLRTN